MSDDKKRPFGSFFPTSQPSNTSPKSSKISPDNFDQALSAALEAGDEAGALEVLDAAPRWINKQPEMMLIRATALLSLGEEQEAFLILREIERKNSRYVSIYLPLSMIYMGREWYAHALQAAKRALSDRDLVEEARPTLDVLIEEATSFIQSLAAEFDLPFETMQRACNFNEQVEIAMDEDKLSEAEYLCREAIKIAPDWNPPYNNRARALYYSGKTTEAVAISEAVLAREIDNIFAMYSLVIYHYGLNQLEKAQEYATRLGELSDKLPADSMEIDQIITSLALVEDTPALWEIAQRYLKAPYETLYDHSWYCLTVAAVRSGKWKDALRLIKKIDKEELSPMGKGLLDELEEVAGRRQPRLEWMPPSYPGADLFLHPRIIAEWEVLLQSFKGDLSPSQKRKLDAFFQKYPFMVTAFKRMLWEKESYLMALQVLGNLGTPEADAEILRFALSDTGSRDARISAILTLIQTGRYTGPKVVKIWDGEQEEWQEVELNTQRIGYVEVNARPQTLAIIEKARKAKNHQEAIALLQKAMEMEPTSPMAAFNLGVILAQNGKIEEGEKLIHHSVEIDPNYTYGHASIALEEADKGHEREALDHLEVVDHAETIAPDTAVLANLARVSLAIRKYDFESARQRLDMASQVNPEHRLLEHYEMMLEAAKERYEESSFLFNFQRESAQRAHRKLLKTPLTTEMGLKACLETTTKDMLVGSAHFLQISSSGKKGELTSRLAEFLLDSEFLQQTFDEDLVKKEREALQWILETDGVRPWKGFIRIYGDDMDESTLWDYHIPESIPGRLRLTGLLYTGTLDGQQVAFIPADVRPLLCKLFG